MRFISWVMLLGVMVAQPTWGDWITLNTPDTGSYARRYRPPGHDASTPTPLVVFFHGSGATPENWESTLEPLANDLGLLLLLPKSESSSGFGPGFDQETLSQALSLLEEEVAVDPRRRSLAGHSSGGAFALVLALGTRGQWSGVFSMGAPYRIILRVEDERYLPPVRFYYGTEDPNWTGGGYSAYLQQMNRLGVEVENDIQGGFGHNTWPEDTILNGLTFLTDQEWILGPCWPSEDRLCLQEGRFGLEVDWAKPSGTTGKGRVVPLETKDSGIFWFFAAKNWELMVKVLDGCVINGHYWLLLAGSTDVQWHLEVTDWAQNGTVVVENPLGERTPAHIDTRAFLCD